MISVAAELSGMHPQTLRIYERKQLINPQRSSGNTRLYSEEDIERLRLIHSLTQDEGINLAGVERIMALQKRDRVRACRGGGAAQADPRPRRPARSPSSSARVASSGPRSSWYVVAASRAASRSRSSSG